MSVGELFVGTTEGAAALTVDRHLVFDWELLTREWSASAFRAATRRRERAFGPERWPTIVLSNHDQPRHASRLAETVGASGADGDAIAKAAAVLTLTLRGTPFLYYGEELGMGDVAVPPDESIDAAASRVGPGFTWWDRSKSRTPMPWTGGPGAGFSTGRPWLRLGDDTARRNVETEMADPDSVLACYRRVLGARHALPSLQDGSLHLVRTTHPDVLGYRRRGSGDEVLVLIGFGAEPMTTTVPRAGTHGWRPVAGTHRDRFVDLPDGAALTLRPFEAVVAVPARARAGSR
jgi:alpha-glucosidase